MENITYKYRVAINLFSKKYRVCHSVKPEYSIVTLAQVRPNEGNRHSVYSKCITKQYFAYLDKKHWPSEEKAQIRHIKKIA